MSTLVVSRVGRDAVALETTLLLHGVPAANAPLLARDLFDDVRSGGAQPALVGVVSGQPIVGLSEEELRILLDASHGKPGVPKANTSNLGVLIARGQHGATTVSTTMELAAAAGLRVFATGGLGGVHKGYGQQFDVSSDLSAFVRHPIAVVASGVKGLLDVVATREALETLGVPVVGYQTDRFPAFYVRESAAGVDARFDDVEPLAEFIELELSRSGRGIVVCNPVPKASELPQSQFEAWMTAAEHEAQYKGISGRDLTPFLLGRLHDLSKGATLRANIDLVRSNARLAGRLARAMAS
ncbi:MAG: pseudouridine-5'-phosphate glycosidase [Phycisphaerales bacterium]